MKFYKSLLALSALAVAACSAKITEAELQANKAQGLRLVSLEDGVDPVWKTDDEVLQLMVDDVGFFDVTDYYEPNALSTIAANRLIATRPSFKPPVQDKLVKRFLADVSIPKMQRNLAKLHSFYNRYYKNETGLAASLWIRDTLQGVIRENRGSRANVRLFSHDGFDQRSIIASIPGSDPSRGRVILGAHMDSINRTDPLHGRAPGADDDGTGTINVMEAFRVLVSGGFKPKSTVEFHLYAGEEAGLLGSQGVARNYRETNVNVKGMFNLDMTAYVKPGTQAVVGFLSDFTNPGLTNFTLNLVEKHLNIPWALGTPCGYACSDHASWFREGFPSAGVLEGDFNNINQKLHTDNDLPTTEGFSWEHSREYAKLAVAFAVELSSSN